ncbi:Protein AFG1 [Pseudozyma hubeiensis]|nr:Protein AFG1 [Pseudozyma hubeiensis]
MTAGAVHRLAGSSLPLFVQPARQVGGRRLARARPPFSSLTSSQVLSYIAARSARPRKSSPNTSCSSSIPGVRSFTSSSLSLSAAKAGKSKASTPIQRYDQLVQDGVLRDDTHQRNIIKVLQSLHDKLKTYKQGVVPDPEEHLQASKGLLSWLPFGKKSNAHEIPPISEDIPKGLYLYGDVGTGKSMLMDLFYDTLPSNITAKRRIHFHQFMIEAHKRAHFYKSKTHKPSGIVMMMSSGSSKPASSSGSAGAASSGEESDAIEAVAREMAHNHSVLCFDEFQVTDIADAMILRGLLERMLAYGVVMVMTSNRHPDELYKNGIQRQSFLPCIDLLKSQLGVTDLNSGTDYRKVPRALSKVYFSPLDDANTREFDKLFDAATSDPHDPVISNRPLKIWGRTLLVPQSTQRVARFTFDELCGRPRSAADYIEICNNFNTIFVDDVPKMGLNQRDLARRFITFIDAAYESKTKLLASSEVPILQIFSGDAGESKPTAAAMRSLMDDLGLTMDDLGGSPIFTGDEELFAFARVISRLTEMGSRQYAEMASTAGTEAPPEY